jgi:hypothetical protein
VPQLPDQLTTILLTALALAAGLLIWLGMAIYVYWDTGQRKMPASLRRRWWLAALVPVAGWLAYIVAGRSAPSRAQPADSPAVPPSPRHTLLKPERAIKRRLPTMAAADLAHATQPRLTESTAPTVGAITRYQVRVLEGPHAGQEFTLLRLPARIGRGPAADVNLALDLGISREQAEIYESTGVLRVRDLASAHGTRVNGQLVTDHVLRADDKLLMGYSVLTVGRAGDQA